MGNNEEAYKDKCFLVETWYFKELILTFKAAKKCIMGMGPWKSLVVQCLTCLSRELESWGYGCWTRSYEGFENINM
jgi:hypothetical protein